MRITNNHRWLALACWLAAASSALAGPEIPGAPQRRPFALVGATVHPVSSAPIERGVVLVDKGKITAVGKELELSEGVEKIDVAGLHVYPGLIDAYTQIGLVEIPSVRGTVDDAETGRINPNVRAQIAFNPDSELIPVTRAGGVLTVLTAPKGNLVAGLSALVNLDGWSTDDMLVRPDVGLHIVWPRVVPLYTWRLDDDHADTLATRDKTLRELETMFDDARAYCDAQKARSAKGLSMLERDVRWESLAPVFAGKVPLMVQADELQQIEGAVALADRQRVKLVIIGGYDAPECADLLKRHKVPVIVGGVTRLPQRRGDAYDAPYTVPARLQAAGVKFCIGGVGRMGNTRNLPHQAGIAAAYGLDPDAALKAITLWPAELLGVADRLGSLETGKEATLIVTNGDPLETPTRIARAYIQGRAVDLTNRQTRLYDKYQEKYRRQRAEAAAE